METTLETRKIDDWVLRVRTPEGPGPHPFMLLLHGWTGDEDSMWVFASRLPKDAILAAPRGLYESHYGGYGWYPDRIRELPWIDDFRPAVEAVMDLVRPENFPTAELEQFRLAGFSQGAALSFALALSHPRRVRALAGLSGFLPEGARTLIQDQPLEGKPVYVAHGTQDNMVPVARARSAVEMLENAGAHVTYCEDDVGHKLSATCFNGLETFFKRN